MVALFDATFLYVGRTCRSHGGRYYMSESHRNPLHGLAREFGRTIYLCQERSVPAETANESVEIDQSLVDVVADRRWKVGRNPFQRLGGLVRDARFVTQLNGPLVTHTYYPGFYSFLLSPVVHRQGDVNLAHFGSDAVDTAEAAYDGISGRIKTTLYRHLQSYVLRTADIVFATDPRMGKAYDVDNVVESKPVIDFDMTDLQPPGELDIDEPVRLLFVGAFRPVKGHLDLIDAVAQLVTGSELGYHLTLVGDGSEVAPIEREVSKRGLEDNVKFTGYVADRERLVRLYRESDVFVIPSHKESVPRVFYEATAMGLPVVSTAVGGIPAFLDDGVHALLVDPEAPEQIAEAVERVVADSELRRRLVTNAQLKTEWYLRGDPVKQRLELIEERL